MTWGDIARRQPEFVQWVVQRYGPLPEGAVTPDDYVRFAAAFVADQEEQDE